MEEKEQPIDNKEQEQPIIEPAPAEFGEAVIIDSAGGVQLHSHCIPINELCGLLIGFIKEKPIKDFIAGKKQKQKSKEDMQRAAAYAG